jgi:hypothetical protein
MVLQDSITALYALVVVEQVQKVSSLLSESRAPHPEQGDSGGRKEAPQ